MNVTLATRCAFALCALALFITGCSANMNSSPSTDSSGALESLRAENVEVRKLGRENQELARLRQENGEIQKLRETAQDLIQLRRENELLHAQIVHPSPKQGQVGQQQAGGSTAAAAPGAIASTNSQPNVDAEGNPIVNAADLPEDGDEILVEPKYLAALLPGFDWEKIQRKEPIAVKNLLDQQGIVLTNYQQLVSLGITNYTIRRNGGLPKKQQE